MQKSNVDAATEDGWEDVGYGRKKGEVVANCDLKQNALRPAIQTLRFHGTNPKNHLGFTKRQDQARVSIRDVGWVRQNCRIARATNCLPYQTHKNKS